MMFNLTEATEFLNLSWGNTREAHIWKQAIKCKQTYYCYV